MSETAEGRQERRAATRKRQGRAWDVGLHRLDNTLRLVDPFFSELELSDTHLVPCQVRPDEQEAFSDLQQGIAYFELLARQADDPSLRRDANAIAAYGRALLDPQPPNFTRLTKSVLGGTIKLPSDNQLDAALHCAERAFFAAFPDRVGQPYDADTIGKALAGYRESVSAAEPETVERFVDRVVTLLLDGSEPRPDYTLDLTSLDTLAAIGAQVTVDQGDITLAYNRGFNATVWPGMSGYMTAHEAAHVVWFVRLQEMIKEGTLPPHLQCIPIISPLALGAELGGEGLPHLPGLPGAEGSQDPVQRWRAVSWRAFMLATSHVFVTMDEKPDSTLEDGVAVVDRWAPDPSNKELFKLFFDTVQVAPVAGRLLFAPYMWAAQVLDIAAENGTAEKVAEAALRGPVDPSALYSVANGHDSGRGEERGRPLSSV